jgi:prepilin-type N-terminal cleavage/methylation domain-containing protein
VNAACPKTTSAKGARAFTLIEVLLALAIMSVITVALFASLHVAFKARDRSEAALEPVRTSEAVMELVRAELESALPPRGTVVAPHTPGGGTHKAGGDKKTHQSGLPFGRPPQLNGRDIGVGTPPPLAQIVNDGPVQTIERTPGGSECDGAAWIGIGQNRMSCWDTPPKGRLGEAVRPWVDIAMRETRS